MPKDRHVCLIALSGVRIYNRELLELGMTLPGFVERGKVIASLPSLGCLTLAGLTPSSWEVEYLEIDELTEASVEAAAALSKTLVGISSLTARINEAYKLADELRRRGKTVVMGGLHVSVMPEEALAHCDAVVVGEGESVWRQLLQDFENDSLRRIYRPERIAEFDPWAVPRFDLLDKDRYNRITLQTTRGCPLDCIFCAASRLISNYKRKRMDRVDAELSAVTSVWPRPFVELADDNTFVNKSWSKELVALLSKYKVKWFTEADISIADDDELLSALSESGCAQVLIGLESVDEGALDETDTKHWKRRRRGRYLEAIDKIQSRGISVNGCFILGFDSDTPTVFQRTEEFVKEARLSEVQITVLTPFPGTGLFAKLKKEGRLRKSKFWDECTLFDVTFRPRGMSIEQLEDGFRTLAGSLYSAESTRGRKQTFNALIRRRTQK